MYLVKMYRWGELDNHNYVIGCFSKEQRAIDVGNWEMDYRGGKYQPVITPVEDCPEGILLNHVEENLKKHIKRFPT